MSWKQYQNELIVTLSLILMLSAWGYKNAQVAAAAEQTAGVQQTVSEFKEVVALQKVWGNKNISKRVEKLHTAVPASKVKWQNKNKKISASYKNLNAKELNRMITSILNLAVQIQRLEIRKNEGSYDLELTCKW